MSRLHPALNGWQWNDSSRNKAIVKCNSEAGSSGFTAIVSGATPSMGSGKRLVITSAPTFDVRCSVARCRRVASVRSETRSTIGRMLTNTRGGRT